MKSFEETYQIIPEQNPQIQITETQPLLKLTCSKIDTLKRLIALNDKLDQLLTQIKIRKLKK